MVRKVFCRKYQEDLEGMSSAPYPGDKGEDIFNNVSQRAWEEWLEHQKMLTDLHLARPFDKKIDFGPKSNGIKFVEIMAFPIGQLDFM